MTGVFDLDRYSRQTLFPGIGQAGQKRLAGATVAVIGCGALGTVSAEMLVRAGVGHVTIIDRDFVEFSNLQRQSLFTEEDARATVPKAVAARRVLSQVNSAIEIEGLVEDVTFENIEQLCSRADVIVDGTDSFEVRFLINDFAVRERRPWMYGAALGSYGISWPVVPGITPCLRCLFEEPPPAGSVETCDTAGVIAPIIHVVASYQVAEALKLLVGAEPDARSLQVDIWKGTWRTMEFSGPVEDCPCCGKRDFPFLEGERRTQLTRLCGRNAVQVNPSEKGKIDLNEMAQKLRLKTEVSQNDYLLKAKLEGCEVVLFADGRAVVKGTDDLTVARAVYSRYIGH